MAVLGGHAARAAGLERAYGTTVAYGGRAVLVGTWEHWQLMERACWAKFTQNEDARQARLGPGKHRLHALHLAFGQVALHGDIPETQGQRAPGNPVRGER